MSQLNAKPDIHYYYSKRETQNWFSYLIFFGAVGILLLLLDFFGIQSDNIPLVSIGYAQIITALLGFAVYRFVQKNPFIRVIESHLYKGILFKKKIPLKELKEVYIFANELVIKTASKEVRIDEALLDQEAFTCLFDFLSKQVEAAELSTNVG